MTEGGLLSDSPGEPREVPPDSPGKPGEFTAHASGKVILLGEHAVVYGVPGLAAGIERGARATARLAPSGRGSFLRLGGSEYRAHASGSDLERAFAALVGESEGDVDVDAEAELPPGGGLGCSAALAVAIAKSVLAARHGRAFSVDSDADRHAVLSRASAWEAIFHGNPSGIDTAAAAGGGCLRFDRGIGPSSIAAPHDLWLAVGYSGRGASTKEMVSGLARLFERKPETADKFLGAVRSLVENAILAIASGDGAGLGKLMDLNQMLLAGVMLSTEPIEAMCRSARAAGALGAKLTGSGGGGSVIALGGASAPGAIGSDAEVVARAVTSAWSAPPTRAEDEVRFTAFTTRISASRGPTQHSPGLGESESRTS